MGFVETHVPICRDPDLYARASSQGYDSVSNVAMNYSSTTGTHGGEMILTAKCTHSMPLEDVILQAAKNANDEVSRFTCVETRFGQMSILVIVTYFLCSEGLSSRNWAILHQISILIRQFKIPFVLYADFNMDPTHIDARGWPVEHNACVLAPNVDSTCLG